jgi:hypothetical protein
MRLSLRTISTLALVALSAPVVRAQKATASATVGTVVPQQGPVAVCSQQGGPGLAAAATCAPTQVKGGKAGAAAQASLLDRTASATIGMVDQGAPGLVAGAEAQSRVTAKIDVSGASEAGDYLVMHFLAALDYQFAGKPSDVFGALITAARGEGDTGASFFTESHFGNQGNATSSNGARRAQGGFDLLLSFDNFTGQYKYTYGVGLQMTVNDEQTAAGYAALGIALASIDAYSAGNQYLGSVVFNEDGSESLALERTDEPSVAPEPASLVLVATGLAGVLGVASRRRRR